jgi:hypothetical protein
MRLSLAPADNMPQHVTAESEALSVWYDDHPEVRHLWAIRNERMLSVILALEPTIDNDDTYPTWFACNQRWTSEIRAIAGGPVMLELLDEPPVEAFEVEVEGVIVAAISWRDPTSFWKAD